VSVDLYLDVHVPASITRGLVLRRVLQLSGRRTVLAQIAGRRAGSAGGERIYAGSYRQGAAETTHTGAFKASAALLSKHTD